MALRPVLSICPIVGRREGFSVSALGFPPPPSRPLEAQAGSRHPTRGTRPRVPGGCPPQCPSPTPSQAARGGCAAPRAHSSRGRGARGGNYRKCREKPWSFPIWSRRRRRRRGRCRQVGVAEPASGARAPRLHEPLPGERTRPLPSRPGPRPHSRPFSGGPAPPRPAPTGDPSASSGGSGGRFGAVNAASSRPASSVPPQVPRLQPLGPWRPGPLHLAAARLNPTVREKLRLSFAEHGKSFRKGWS